MTTAGGIRGIIISIKDDSIMIRVAPDNLKLEVAKNAIASVTQEDASKSLTSLPGFQLYFWTRETNHEEESQETRLP